MFRYLFLIIPIYCLLWILWFSEQYLYTCSILVIWATQGNGAILLKAQITLEIRFTITFSQQLKLFFFKSVTAKNCSKTYIAQPVLLIVSHALISFYSDNQSAYKLLRNFSMKFGFVALWRQYMGTGPSEKEFCRQATHCRPIQNGRCLLDVDHVFLPFLRYIIEGGLRWGDGVRRT